MDAPTADMACTENDSTETVDIAAEKPPSGSVDDIVVADLFLFAAMCVNPIEHNDDSEAWGKYERSREKTHRVFLCPVM